MTTLAEDVRRQTELLERVQLEIHLAHNRVFHTTATSWEAALRALEHAADLRATSRRLPPETPPAEETPAADFAERWETL